jgi:predicted transcriptional regulator of viral defense system
VEWQEQARRQAGAIERRQLLAGGLTPARVKGAIARGELIALLPGVYTARLVPRSVHQSLWAAQLWSDGGAVSHRSAARLWQLSVERETTVHITVDDRRYRKPIPGVCLHRVPLGRLAQIRRDGLLV